MKKLATIITTFAISCSALSAYAFPDIGTDTKAWAGEAIDRLSRQNIINGYEDGTFRPESNITRAEFAKMMCIAFETTESTDNTTYEDTNNHWARDYINLTLPYTYTSGTEYRPDQYASRGEIAYALARVRGLEATDAEKIISSFSDGNTVVPEIRDKVAAAIEYGLMQGYEDKSLRSDNPVTRAEVAVLIDRTMNIAIDEPEELPEEIPPVQEPSDTPDSGFEENTQAPDNKEDIFDGLDHIYTLYPLENMLLVSSVTRTVTESGDDGYRLKYYMPGDETEYSSLIADTGETTVAGLRDSFAAIRKGDVLILDMAFLTHIKTVYVIASMDAGSSGVRFAYPEGGKIGKYGSGRDYELIGGRVTATAGSNKSYKVTITAEDTETTLYLPKGVEVNLYNKRKSDWTTDTVSSIDEEDGYIIFVRYTDSVVTDIIAVADEN